MKKRVLKEIISWGSVIVISFVVAILINRFIVFRVEIPTGSMENTIEIGDSVITYRLAYLFGDPKRGDIVVFPAPDDEEVDYIKRIIGLPGETVEGLEGTVYINGEPLTENYVKEFWLDNFGPYEVPENSYFMMGDNRNDSEDSRYWSNMFLTKNKIKGKALFKFPSFAWLK